ncbi:uncharacterized protein LOC62_06G008806 [Vanrija pseudolonga]|uniref:Acyl-CoA thioesterase-like N-terminal HotDog domain-containing protein n=1 Tax=Vanrija pseudolonga TaxID=143232 RepID=A0AAF1BPB9_9TREE|nr:hypothetical protein LOC62_06G008806 [Vanrija pseudolonga]
MTTMTVTETLTPIAAAAPLAKPAPTFDDAISVSVVDPTTVPAELKDLFDLLRADAKAIYAANILPSFGNTPAMPNGGHLGSVILNACLAHQAANNELLCRDPLSIAFDYLAPTNMGPAFVVVRNNTRGGRKSGMQDVQADMFQLQEVKTRDADAPRVQLLVQTIRSSALFGTFSTKGPSAAYSDHFGPRPPLEDTPAPHPKSWYLPPKVAMLSHQLDLLVHPETERRPRADYWIRFHPPGVPLQQFDAGGVPEDYVPPAGPLVKNSLTLPLRAPSARRVDLAALPTFADFRRPAMENVLKKDACSPFDEPTRKWAYPTLSLTLRFLRPLAAAPGEVNPEWLYVGWREQALNGRVTSEFKMENENGEAICVGSMDTIMLPIEWFKM